MFLNLFNNADIGNDQLQDVTKLEKDLPHSHNIRQAGISLTRRS